jgi:hypothetical protein
MVTSHAVIGRMVTSPAAIARTATGRTVTVRTVVVLLATGPTRSVVPMEIGRASRVTSATHDRLIRRCLMT